MTADHRAQAREALLDLARDEGAARWIVATGGSMRPLIRPGDRLLVAIGARPERIGQVVIVQRDGTSVAHRIVAIRSDRPAAPWVMKGDAEPIADAPVATEDVVGVVLGRGRSDGSTHRRGFDGRLARTIARFSWVGGRVAWRLRRMSRRLPAWAAAIGLRILIPLTRVPTRLISAPIPWLDQETRAEGR
jgi:hypothetical protein